MLVKCMNCGKTADYEMPPGQEFSCECGAKLMIPREDDYKNYFSTPILAILYSALGIFSILAAVITLTVPLEHKLEVVLVLLLIALVMFSFSSVIYYLAKIEFNSRKS